MDEYLVECEHISKSFSGVRALDDVGLRVRGGEVLALLGENGAGKSTLMKILSGVYTRDSGVLRVGGREVGDLTPAGARELGISIIHQELNLCPHLTVAENVFLGREPVRKGVLDRREMNRRTAEILGKLRVNLSPDTIVSGLSVSMRQLVEIARALETDARVLIMDEPTSALTERETEDLFVLIRRLRDEEGKGIVYISHRLEELRRIADRVAILRDGRFVTEAPFAGLTMEQIIAHMVGREIKEKFPRVSCGRGERILEVRALCAGKKVRDVSFSLYAGEILGIAGLMGAGRTETTRALFGVDPKENGEILLDGRVLSVSQPRDAIGNGIVLIPEDRKKDGLCTRLSVRENIALPNLDAICDRRGIVVRRRETELVERTIKNLSVKLSGPEIEAGRLSGGNQQKIVIGRWLARKARVVMFDEPTRGIDVAAKVEIYNLMNNLKKSGIGVLFVSSEMPEIVGLADRILVMCNGRITGEFESGNVTQNRIMEKATQFDGR